jgi:hypothetical protein
MRRPAGDAAGDGAVRPREGLVHRRHDHAQGPIRGRGQGHHLPGRDRRDDAGHPATWPRRWRPAISGRTSTTG